MQTVNIHEAKTHLSKLVERAAAGETIILAKSGKPRARLMPIDQPEKAKRRLGMLQGMFDVPDDIKTTFKDEIEEMFYGNPDKFA